MNITVCNCVTDWAEISKPYRFKIKIFDFNFIWYDLKNGLNLSPDFSLSSWEKGLKFLKISLEKGSFSILRTTMEYPFFMEALRMPFKFITMKVRNNKQSMLLRNDLGLKVCEWWMRQWQLKLIYSLYVLMVLWDSLWLLWL